MNTVTFIIVGICSLAAAVIALMALVRLHRKDLKAKGTLVIAFGIWLLGIVLGSILFGFFSL
jgi:uncharacterized membrane protein YwaF